jgi:hypothetical protein
MFTLNDKIDLCTEFLASLFSYIFSDSVISLIYFQLTLSFICWSAFMILGHMEILGIHRICYLRLQRQTSGRVHR